MPQPPETPAQTIIRSSRMRHNKSGVMIEGIDNVLIHLANCCHPVAGEPIMGFITHQRGVSVHSRFCTELLRLQSEEPERVIEVQWQKEMLDSVQAVNIMLKAWDRTGLLRDITAVLLKIQAACRQ